MKVLSPIIAIALLFVGACAPNDADTKPPSLLLSAGTSTYGPDSICGEEASDVFVLKSSEELKLEIYVVDDEALSQMKIDIHENYDCHGHNKKTQDWYHQEIIDLDGNEGRISKALKVPDDVTAGNYHLGLLVIDAAGNEGNQQAYDIKVENGSDVVSPEIKLISPSERTLKVKKGQMVSIQVAINDNLSLLDGSKWSLKYQDLTGGNYFKIIEEGFNTSESNLVATHNFEVPVTWVAGDYEVSVQAYDAVNNASRVTKFTLSLE